MLREVFLLFFLAIYGLALQSIDEDEIGRIFERGLEEYMRTGQNNSDLDQALEIFQFPGLFYQTSYRNTPKANLACLGCNIVAKVAIAARRKGASNELISKIATLVCIWFKVGSVEYCNGYINMHKDAFLYMIDHKPDLTPQRVCVVLYHTTGCEDPSIGDGWTIDLPEKSTNLKNVNVRNGTRAIRQEPLKILQLSDVHYDPNYAVGSKAACSEALCCQAGTVPEKEEDAAGYWGDYRVCDTPWRAFVDSLEHIMVQHKLDYVYYTGDIVDHKVWDTSIEHNTESVIKVLNEFKKYFGDIPLFPILGNHEPHPVDSFSSDGVFGPHVSTKWIFELSAQEWKKWLPDDTQETILRGGYYTALVKEGFRIVALNSNVCYVSNWWLIFDDYDPYGQLRWLVKVLHEAENNGEKVHILSHVPTADDTCWFNWGREFSRIVRRFSDTIVAQFNGHTHFKENVIYYDSDDLTNPINVAFNGGSLTAFINVNPNYVVYDVDSTSAEVLDYTVWIYDIDEANKTPEKKPRWFELYSFKETYGTNSLQAKDMGDLVLRFTKDRELIEKYSRFKWRNSRPGLERGCNDECLLSNLCYMVTSYHGDRSHCDEIKRLWHASNSNLFM